MKYSKMTDTTRIAAVGLLAMAFLGGCASNEEIPTQQLARAETLVQQAEQSGARENSPLELDQAREKLQGAHAAVEQEEFISARFLAEQAAADAELAAARSRAATAEAAADEIQDVILTLQRETRR